MNIFNRCFGVSRILILSVILVLINNSGYAQNRNDLKVLLDNDGSVQNRWMLKRLSVQFDHRRNEVEIASQSAEKLLARRDSMRKWFIDKVGELPPKVPLNPVFGQKMNRRSYTIQPVSFESQSKHHVTALLYTPVSGKPPYPAVYIPCGHSAEGKNSMSYRSAATLFAMNGFVVLQADPIWQGERQQYLDEAGEPLSRTSGTLEHELVGQSLLLTGSNTLISELIDNIRCIDFLEQQTSVDKEKIAVAGNSGGGTQATYLSAYDRRIEVVVPSCYIATTEKKFNTIGSQDGCQQLWGEGKAGIEEQDFLFMAAPIPILISSAKEDYFSIDGAVVAFEELKELYTVLGYPERIDQAVSDSSHGWSLSLREAAVRWCKEWFMDDTSFVSENGKIKREEPVLATATGQVLTAFAEEKSVTDISIGRMENARIARSEFQKKNKPEQILTTIKELCGFEGPGNRISAEIKQSIRGKGYSIEKLLIVRDKEMPFYLPALLFVPDNIEGESPAVIIVGEQGKDTLLTADCQIMKEINKGNIVLAVDVSNTGELKYKRNAKYNNDDFWVGKLALYEGKTLMTYRAEELIMAKRFLQNNPKVDKHNISIYSTGFTGPAALHAAFFEQNFRKVTIQGAINTWEEVASFPYSENQLGNIVPNALNYYDLPDLVRWTPETKIEIIDPVDAVGNQIAVQWHCWKHTLTSHHPAVPSTRVDVVFSGPDGETFRTPAFTDNGKTYHFQAAFPSSGVWSWKTVCSDITNPGIHNREGRVKVSSYEGDNPLYRHGDLKVGDNKRFLVHDDGTPFLWMGDTGWTVALKSTMEEWCDYVDIRARQGFSVIQVTPTGFIKKTPDSARGATSFTEEGKPDPLFWQNLEDKVSYANEKGIIILFVGVGGGLSNLFSQHPENQDFATYLAARFAGHMVIFSPSFDQKLDEGNRKVARELGPLTRHLVTQHPGTHYASIVEYRDDSSLSFCGLQSGHHNGTLPMAYRAARLWTLDMWEGKPVKPVINIETMYDGYGDNNGPNWREKDARKLGWIAWLSGSKGYTYGAGDDRPKIPHGNGGVWKFNEDSTTYDYWRKALLWPSAKQMTVMRDFFGSIDWWNLEPEHELVLNQPEEDMKKMVVSTSKESNLILTYLPDNQEITLNLEGKPKRMKGQWFNPVTGDFIAIKKPVVTRARVKFSKPRGWDDALLILSAE